MKIKITQAGSESYTGFLGDVQFFGGVSVGDISEQSAAGIAAIYAIERIGDDVEEVIAPVVEKTEPEAKVETLVAPAVASIATEAVPEAPVATAQVKE